MEERKPNKNLGGKKEEEKVIIVPTNSLLKFKFHGNMAIFMAFFDVAKRLNAF
jgi:hypothetical protein